MFQRNLPFLYQLSLEWHKESIYKNTNFDWIWFFWHKSSCSKNILILTEFSSFGTKVHALKMLLKILILTEFGSFGTKVHALKI